VTAAATEAKFRSAITNVTAKLGSLQGATLGRYEVPGDSNKDKLSHVVSAWEAYKDSRPGVGGFLAAPELALVWPPPFLEMLRVNRDAYGGGAAPAAPLVPVREPDAPQRKRRRTTSRVAAVQQQQDLLDKAEMAMDQPGALQ
jgi:hypothetical protein